MPQGQSRTRLAVPAFPDRRRLDHEASGPDTDPVRHDLTAETIRLTRLVRVLMPEDGEVSGLLALMLLTEARRAPPGSPRAAN